MISESSSLPETLQRLPLVHFKGPCLGMVVLCVTQHAAEPAQKQQFLKRAKKNHQLYYLSYLHVV